jgi:Ca-activated chloride channel family protein
LLLRVGLKGKEIKHAERPQSNLVFLLDVSGSMSDANKLPLLKTAMQMLVRELGENDRVSIVTYAGEAGLKLPPTRGHEQEQILGAIESLRAGGSTNGSAGIELAYEQAAAYFVKGGTNRVILCTDGDLNVGVTSDNALVELIKKKAAGGVFLTVLGFGEGNLKDAKMEKLADNGNGLYAYIDSVREAKKVLVEQLTGSTITIAKDVKIQIEFNPAQIAAYRLLGYENRVLATEDFNNDKKDAGEIGAGHTVTALYELVPVGATSEAVQPRPATDPLKYQQPGANLLPAIVLEWPNPRATACSIRRAPSLWRWRHCKPVAGPIRGFRRPHRPTAAPRR